jgi:FG-GAP-like repeat
MNQSKTYILFFLIVLLFFVPRNSKCEERFTQYYFKLKGQITDIISEDINADGNKEIIVIHTDQDSDPHNRYLTIYRHIPGMGFSTSNSTRWKISPDVSVLDVGDVSADPGKELVFVTESGIFYAPIKNWRVGKLKKIFSTQSVVTIPFELSVPYYNFVRDYTGDGKDDILVCGFYDTALAEQKENYTFNQHILQFRPGIEINTWDTQFLAPDQEHPIMRASYYVPRIFSEDYDGDGVVDLIANFRGEVFVFRQKDNKFEPEPYLHFKIRVFEKFIGRKDSKNHPNLEFSDLDGDGMADIISRQARGEFGEIETKVMIYFGKNKGAVKNIPDVEFYWKSLVFAVFINDVNNDGMPDLVMPSFDLTAWTVSKAFITNQLTVEWLYFIQNPDRTFNDKPDRIVPMELIYNISKLKLESGIPNVFGDFNGDGTPDLLLGKNKDTYILSLQDNEGGSFNVEEKIEIPVSVITRASDLNSDGMSDLIIFYDRHAEYSSEFRILINKGGWGEKKSFGKVN